MKTKNSWFVLLALAVLMASVMPATFAAADEGKGNSESVSAAKLRFKMMCEGFSDFGFNVKHFFTFDDAAKVELIKERNEKMKERQKEWLEIKADTLASIDSGNMSAEEKKEVVELIQEKHEDLINGHLQLTNEIHELELKGKGKGDSKLEVEAEEESGDLEKSEVSMGLNIPLRGHSGLALLTERVKSDNSTLTADAAKALVDKRFGLKDSQVSTVVENGTTFFVVTGNTSMTLKGFTLAKTLTVKVQADTGRIVSIDFSAHIESTGDAANEIEAKIAGNKTKVEAFIDGIKDEFVLNTTVRAEIIAQVAERTGLTPEEVESVIDFDVRAEERTEIEVEIEDGMAQVKTDIRNDSGRTKSEFTLNTTNETEIISEIASRTGLSVEEIENNLEIKGEGKLKIRIEGNDED